jgi:hypothetical protein
MLPGAAETGCIGGASGVTSCLFEPEPSIWNEVVQPLSKHTATHSPRLEVRACAGRASVREPPWGCRGAEGSSAIRR